MPTYEITAEVLVRVRVDDPTVITRCTENEGGWREDFYAAVDTPEAVFAHLLYNHLANRVDTISRLDGWADVDDEDVEFFGVAAVDVHLPPLEVAS